VFEVNSGKLLQKQTGNGYESNYWSVRMSVTACANVCVVKQKQLLRLNDHVPLMQRKLA
jgi:hypothetical protein